MTVEEKHEQEDRRRIDDDTGAPGRLALAAPEQRGTDMRQEEQVEEDRPAGRAGGLQRSEIGKQEGEPPHGEMHDPARRLAVCRHRPCRADASGETDRGRIASIVLRRPSRKGVIR